MQDNLDNRQDDLLKVHIDLWCARVLYVVGAIPSETIAEYSDIPQWLLKETCEHENWLAQREGWMNLKPEEQDSRNIQIAIFGYPKSGSHDNFLQNTIADSRKHKSQDHHLAIEQQISQLTEFGMTRQQAADFVERTRQTQGKLERKLAGDLALQTADIPFANDSNKKGAYSNLARFQHRRLIECEEMLWEYMQIYYQQLGDCIGSDFDPEVVGRQKGLAANAIAFEKIFKLYYQMSGMKGFIDSHGAIARLHANGFSVVRDSEVESE